ncbi:hypothetical protein EJ08DRAFT_649123 [Tothia fuscella]|uniref:Uncharacterized protein n=1 Tax=Tothia fuscella TaxID=1048955 RepID=A0A9P4TZ57_9PEZI|nr:hypothetical protein EJ08DRAFT_649123 [Tothia fuscella]
MNTTTISSNHSTFRFLSLPRELRDFVYHYYATSHPDIPIGPTYSKTFKTTKPYLHSIFLVNKQLKHEYLPCLLKVATFYYVVASWNLSRIWNCYTRSIFKISPPISKPSTARLRATTDPLAGWTVEN